MGGPGSGKGTIAELLMRGREFNYIETGALFRSLPADSDIAEIMRCGGLIPDEKIFPLITKVCGATDASWRDILFDGFPRNVSQVRWLIENFRACRIAVIYLSISESVMVSRIHKRLVLGSARADDAKDAIIRRRLGAFSTETLPAIEFLRNAPGVEFLEIDGTDTPGQIAKTAANFI